MKNIFLILLLFVCFNNHLFGQKLSEQSSSNTINQKLNNTTIVFKYSKFNSTNIQPLIASILNKYQKDIEVSQPFKKYVSQRDSSIDLSNITFISFDSLSVNKYIIYNLINKSNMIQWVEFLKPSNNELMYFPNDFHADGTTKNQYLHFSRTHAYEAWDVEKGDTNVVIAILDTGTDLNHEDLKDNIKYNWADPINGIDDDGDGYVDNFRGWDVANNDNNPQYVGPNHGVLVQSASSATTDNSIGVAGSGFKCKALPIKINFDNTSNLSWGYNGILYAAEHGASIINCSWGSPSGYSQLEQDIINYVTYVYDALVIASAGNTNAELDFFPASYDNVLSVTSLDTNWSSTLNQSIETRTYINPSQAVTYSFNVDVSCLNGSWVAFPGNAYNIWGGTSYAAPFVAGAAGLVRSKFPNLKAYQVAEKIRATAKNIDTFPEARVDSKYKIGRMLNMYDALIKNTPGVKALKMNLASKYSTENFYHNDTVLIDFNLFNFLAPTKSLELEIIAWSGNADLIIDKINVGVIDSLSIKYHADNPLKIKINSLIDNDVIELVLLLRDPLSGYEAHQGFKFTINKDYINIDTNQTVVTATSNGRVGYSIYETTSPSGGIGINYKKNNNLLYDAGLMIGMKGSYVSDAIRNTSTPDKDFKSVQKIKYVSSNLKDLETRTIFNDSLAANILGLTIEQRAYAWKQPGLDSMVIFEYLITNDNNAKLDSVYVGLFADWDIGNYSENRAGMDLTSKLGYIFNTVNNGPFGAISLLYPNNFMYYAIDNSLTGGNHIYMYDGFVNDEKFKSLSSGFLKTDAGISGNGGDVSHVISCLLDSIMPGETKTVAFSIITGADKSSIINQSVNAFNKFKEIKTGPIPYLKDTVLCGKGIYSIPLNHEEQLSYYNDESLLNKIYTGTNNVLTNINKTDSVYITNVDSIFESASIKYKYTVDTLKAGFSLSPNDFIYPFELINIKDTSHNAFEIKWYMGDGNVINSLKDFDYFYNNIGNYTVQQIITSSLFCKDTAKYSLKIEPTNSTFDVTSNVNFDIYPNPISDKIIINNTQHFLIDKLVLENELGINLLEKNHIQETEISLDCSYISDGIYCLKIYYQNNIDVIKIIKSE